MNLPKRSTPSLKITGVPVVLDRKEWTVTSPDVGHYVGCSAIRHPSRVECPYCHDFLYEISSIPPRTIGRILWLESSENQRIDAIVDMVPSTHQTLVCTHCLQAFTVPRE